MVGLNQFIIEGLILVAIAVLGIVACIAGLIVTMAVLSKQRKNYWKK